MADTLLAARGQNHVTDWPSYSKNVSVKHSTDEFRRFDQILPNSASLIDFKIRDTLPITLKRRASVSTTLIAQRRAFGPS